MNAGGIPLAFQGDDRQRHGLQRHPAEQENQHRFPNDVRHGARVYRDSPDSDRARAAPPYRLIDGGSRSSPVSVVAPVVVIAETVSKYASVNDGPSM